MEVESDYSFQERNQGPVAEAGIPRVMFQSQAVQVNIETGQKSCQVNMRGETSYYLSPWELKLKHMNMSVK